jgi:hypothetical protein
MPTSGPWPACHNRAPVGRSRRHAESRMVYRCAESFLLTTLRAMHGSPVGDPDPWKPERSADRRCLSAGYGMAVCLCEGTMYHGARRARASLHLLRSGYSGGSGYCYCVLGGGYSVGCTLGAHAVRGRDVCGATTEGPTHDTRK